MADKEAKAIIVKAIEEEKQLVLANKRLIEIFEQKIKTKISEVWGQRQVPINWRVRDFQWLRSLKLLSLW